MAIVNHLQSNHAGMKKLGRNDLCACGSGKKYKKCCLNMDTIEYDKDYQVPDSFIQRVKQRHADNAIIFGRSEEVGSVKMSEVII
ncbi:MAG: SEC-C metal-binding domain-containing protein [Alphaproteobacteria bacterium]